MSSRPKVSISEITTVSASFREDIEAYRAAGVQGIGIWEFKLTDDAADREALRASGLPSTAVPSVPSILPLPLMQGPLEPEARVEALCASVRRLAAFEPTSVLCLTGPRGELDEGEARRLVVEGLRAIAAEAERAGVRFGVEPTQRMFGSDLDPGQLDPRDARPARGGRQARGRGHVRHLAPLELGDRARGCRAPRGALHRCATRGLAVGA